MRHAGMMLAACLLAGAVQAQDEFDPYDPRAQDETAARSWVPFGEALLRADRVSGLPGGRDDLERIRGRVRLGLLRSGERVDFGVALKAGAGSDDNRDNLANNDNERSDRAGLDQFWIRVRSGERGSIAAGRLPLPLELSPMLWDTDLRPTGAAARWSGAAGDFDRWQLDLGAFEPDPLGHRDGRLGAVQLAWHWREGAPFGGGLLLSYLHWDGIDELARVGLGRGNSLALGRYVHDYRLLDLQGYLRWRPGEKPLEARLDRVRNLDSPAAADGTRASLVWGDRFALPGWELGWAWQRIERDAVLAATTADDWWFHTAARGHMPWVGYGFGRWSMRLAAFLETRDGLAERTERLLLDLEARW